MRGYSGTGGASSARAAGAPHPLQTLSGFTPGHTHTEARAQPLLDAPALPVCTCSAFTTALESRVAAIEARAGQQAAAIEGVQHSVHGVLVYIQDKLAEQDEERRQLLELSSPEARREQINAARARLAGRAPRAGAGEAAAATAHLPSGGSGGIRRDEELRRRLGQVEIDSRAAVRELSLSVDKLQRQLAELTIRRANEVQERADELATDYLEQYAGKLRRVVKDELHVAAAQLHQDCTDFLRKNEAAAMKRMQDIDSAVQADRDEFKQERKLQLEQHRQVCEESHALCCPHVGPDPDFY